MENQLSQRNSYDKDQFEKYPKNYFQNKHYKSLKQKFMTHDDDQEIIKFPVTQSYRTSRNNWHGGEIVANQKIQKWRGKKCQTIPMRTISYSTPVTYTKINQFQKNKKGYENNTIKGYQFVNKQLEINKLENKFCSKFQYENMKKLKSLRKNNYKKRHSLEYKQVINQKKMTDVDQKLDLFRMTSTNFAYQKKQRITLDQSEKIQNSDQTKAMTQERKRNVIRYKNFEISPKKHLGIPLHQQDTISINKSGNFVVLDPVHLSLQRTRSKDHKDSNDKHEKALFSQKEQLVEIQRKNLEQLITQNDNKIDLINSNTDPNYQEKQAKDVFKRYSEAIIFTQDQEWKKYSERSLQKFILTNRSETDQQNLLILDKGQNRNSIIRRMLDQQNKVIQSLQKHKITKISSQQSKILIKKKFKLQYLQQDNLEESPSKYNRLQHIPNSFRGSFRIKHVDDNKNVLITTIKKKAKLSDNKGIMEFIKKITN